MEVQTLEEVLHLQYRQIGLKGELTITDFDLCVCIDDLSLQLLCSQDGS